MKKLLRFLLFVFLCVTVFGQFSNHKTPQDTKRFFAGTVTAENSLLLSGLTVILTDTQTGKKRRTKTEDDGWYVFKYIPFGTYTLTFGDKKHPYIPATTEKLELGGNGGVGYNMTLKSKP